MEFRSRSNYAWVIATILHGGKKTNNFFLRALARTHKPSPYIPPLKARLYGDIG